MNPASIGTRAVHIDTRAATIDTRGANIDMPFAARSPQ
jgi:hypothetical protein